MNDACYCSSDGKIYGVSGPYVIQCNGTTGRREGFVRVTAPVYGDMGICYHAATDSLYVSAIWEPNRQYFGSFSPTNEFPCRDIFPVSTSLVVGANIQMWTIVDNHPPYGGCTTLASNGNYLYTAQSTPASSGTPSYYAMLGFDPTNLADNSFTTGNKSRPQNFGFSPTHVIVPNPNLLANNSHVQIALLGSLGTNNEVYILPYNPCAGEYCPANSKFYVVCGNDTLVRIDTITPFPGTFTALNLGAVEASADPYRIRYWSGTGMLYLPCPTANGVIVWNPNTETGEFKSGFDNPIDIVATGSKVFAVQNAQIGLREIN